jgi:hypothetical protein
MLPYSAKETNGPGRALESLLPPFGTAATISMRLRPFSLRYGVEETNIALCELTVRSSVTHCSHRWNARCTINLPFILRFPVNSKNSYCSDIIILSLISAYSLHNCTDVHGRTK